MIPHTPKTSLRTRKARLLSRAHRRARSAELSSHESGNPSTGLFGFRDGFRLREHANHGFRAGGPDEHPATAVEARVQALDLLAQRLWQLLVGDADVLLRLREPRHHGGRFGERPAL